MDYILRCVGYELEDLVKIKVGHSGMGANIIRAKIEEIKCKYRVGLLI
jgi:hypothetical protein